MNVAKADSVQCFEHGQTCKIPRSFTASGFIASFPDMCLVTGLWWVWKKEWDLQLCALLSHLNLIHAQVKTSPGMSLKMRNKQQYPKLKLLALSFCTSFLGQDIPSQGPSRGSGGQPDFLPFRSHPWARPGEKKTRIHDWRNSRKQDWRRLRKFSSGREGACCQVLAGEQSRSKSCGQGVGRMWKDP